MKVIDVLWYTWPWIGAGGGVVLLLFLFCTDALRSDKNRSRLRDPVWLSWVIAAAYLIHVLEEYGLHVSDGQYVLIQTFIETGVDARFGGIPLIFFPYVNIMLTWVALPVAAVISRRNPVIGLSGIGFVLVNGLTHLGSVIGCRLT